MPEERPYGFDVTGTFHIDTAFEPELSCIEDIVGFKLPDGRTVRLAVALEVESADGESHEYVTSEKEMADLGFTSLLYAFAEFEDGDGDND